LGMRLGPRELLSRNAAQGVGKIPVSESRFCGIRSLEKRSLDDDRVCRCVGKEGKVAMTLP
jgi:hypothetical protein